MIALESFTGQREACAAARAAQGFQQRLYRFDHLLDRIYMSIMKNPVNLNLRLSRKVTRIALPQPSPN